jgi:hypothetical protein
VPHGFLYSIVVPSCSAYDLMDVSTNPGSHKRRGGFRTRRSFEGRLAGVHAGRRSYISSRVLLTGCSCCTGPAWGCPIGTGLPQCRGWFHNVRNGGTRLGMAARRRAPLTPCHDVVLAERQVSGRTSSRV